MKHASFKTESRKKSQMSFFFLFLVFFLYHTHNQHKQRRDAANGDEEKLKRRDEMKSDEIPEGSFS